MARAHRPPAHRLHGVVREAFVVAFVIGALYVPLAMQRAVDWSTDKHAEPVIDVIEDLNEQQNERFHGRLGRSGMTVAD